LILYLLIIDFICFALRCHHEDYLQERSDLQKKEDDLNFTMAISADIE